MWVGGNLYGALSAEVFRSACLGICEETVTVTVRAVSSGKDWRILATVQYSIALRYNSDIEQMVKRGEKQKVLRVAEGGGKKKQAGGKMG